MEVFALANLGLQRAGITREPAYQIRILANQAGLVTASCGLKLQADVAYADLQEELDTLIIPGSPDVSCVVSDPHLTDWVRYMSHRVRRLVSVCTGAFLLAETGLLDGRRATTHWAYCDSLAADYPAVRVEADRIFLRDGAISTSGGITSGIDLTLALLEEDWGREAALLTARYMVVFLQAAGRSIPVQQLSGERGDPAPGCAGTATLDHGASRRGSAPGDPGQQDGHEYPQFCPRVFGRDGDDAREVRRKGAHRRRPPLSGHHRLPD